MTCCDICVLSNLFRQCKIVTCDLSILTNNSQITGYEFPKFNWHNTNQQHKQFHHAKQLLFDVFIFYFLYFRKMWNQEKIRGMTVTIFKILLLQKIFFPFFPNRYRFWQQNEIMMRCTSRHWNKLLRIYIERVSRRQKSSMTQIRICVA